MRLKRLLCMVLACMLIAGSISTPAYATEVYETAPDGLGITFQLPRATGSFNMTIPAKTKLSANFSFPLVVGETVTINASYAPFSADVDFGLIDPHGVFYYFKITDGSINKTIQITESGDYRLQIRNNSDFEVEVSGFVNY